MSDIPFGVWDFILERLSLESLELCCQGLNKAWNEYLLEWRVRALCWVLAAKGVDEVVMRLKRHHPSGISTDLGRLDQVRRFVERHRDARVESVWEWMQLASQEPDAGWLCKGVSSAMMKGAGKCVMRQIVGKPQAFGLLLDTINSSRVTCVAWNHDGSLLASGSSDGTVRLWTPDGQEKGTLRGHTKDNQECTCTHGEYRSGYEANPECPVTGHSAPVNSVAFSPDSKFIASGSGELFRRDNSVRIWDVSTGEEVCSLRGHSHLVRCVTFSPDGSLLACASDDRTVKLLDPTTMEEKGTLTGHSGYVLSVAFSPDSNTLASSSDDMTVKLWDLSGDTPMKKGTLTGHSAPVNSVAFSPNSKFIASGSGELYTHKRDRSVRIWDVSSGKEVHSPRGHDCPVLCVAFSPDGKFVASASGEHDGGTNCVRIWDVDAMEDKGTLGHSMRVLSVAFSPDSKTLASASNDQTVKLWDLSGETLVEKGTLSGRSRPVYSVAWNHDGSLLASGICDGTVRLWTPDGQDKGTLRGHSRWVFSVAFSPDSKTLASASHETVKLWDLSGDAPVEKGTLNTHTPDNPECTCTLEVSSVRVTAGCPVKGHSWFVTCVAWNHDGSLLASGSEDGSVRLWTPDGLEKGTLTARSGAVCCVAWNHDGSMLATGSELWAVRLWTPDGQEKCTLKGHTHHNPECTCTEYDREDDVVAAGCPAKGHTDVVVCVAWNHDGSLLATGSWDKTVRLWTPDGQEKGTLRGHSKGNPECICRHHQGFVGWEVDINAECPVWGHSEAVRDVAWNHDGSLLASLSDDWTVRLWTPDGQGKGILKGNMFSWQGWDRETKELAAKVKEGRSAGSNRTDQYIVTEDRDTVYVYKTTSDGEEQGEPLSCFRSPASVRTFSCMGIKVVVGCEDGQVSK